MHFDATMRGTPKRNRCHGGKYHARATGGMLRAPTRPDAGSARRRPVPDRQFTNQAECTTGCFEASMSGARVKPHRTRMDRPHGQRGDAIVRRMPVPKLPVRRIVTTGAIIPLGMERDADGLEGKDERVERTAQSLSGCLDECLLQRPEAGEFKQT